MKDNTIYDEAELELLTEDDEITAEEEGFMLGYLRAINQRFIKS